MKLDEAFSPRILLLLGLLSMSRKPQQRARAGHRGFKEPLENRLTVMQMSKITRLILQTIKSLRPNSDGIESIANIRSCFRGNVRLQGGC
ncbi:hypothetical protein Taro_048987 [Colocasia esculenta]|uniref:Uncharacterized protein n=1 Tax=Colocasia esculenta TaxID=4460 RepID=A0A843X9M5_COLES|nr:hypothetical protein [Colocasia esculenta]